MTDETQPCRKCGNCRFYRGPGQHCASEDWLVSSRAVRWDDDGTMCQHHEREGAQ